jgi:hypothetical protein
MVQAKTLERLISLSPEIAQAAGTDPATAKRIMEAIEERIKSNRRHPREPAPQGSISLRVAAKKYHIPSTTLSFWVKRGYLKVLERTPNWLYIDEECLIKYLREKEREAV